ncbi:MAG: sensor histidine kinase [Cyclobacteriaceae bacterium]
MNLPSRVVKRLPILAAGILWWGFHTWVLNQKFGFDFDLSAFDALASVNWIMMSCGLLEVIITKYTPKVGKYQFIIGLSLVIAFLCNWISFQVFENLDKQNTAYLFFLGKSFSVRLGFVFLILTGWSVGLVYRKQVKDLEDSINHQTSTETIAREAELQKLQLQLQPHFLFNSLNSINALILVNPAKARDMVQQLSDFLRSTLKRADEHWITLDQELAYLQLYLSIEKVRFGHRLDVQLDCDEQIKLWLIPPLLIQPLVENAIKFGLYGTTEAVVISMKTQRINDTLQIEIVNPFDADMQPAEGSGFGLNGLKRRLYLLYTRNDLLKTTIENNKFTVQLTLPEKI